ncbi:MAG: Formiminotetrahydrofolate cyclodeaminase [Nevskia sp.]|nr:Formiminotetrahydrofolate cyclodeaminase [Nevskia sp.]
MDERLLDHRASELLEKFGAGNHKPGSGSAAAFQGLLSSQLMRTVIELTNDPKRRTRYASHLPRLLEIKSRIENHIYPALETLLQADSVQFDKVIKLRQACEEEVDAESKRELATAALQALILATEIPVEIANHSIELAGFATFVFDNGFRSARGDAGVALHAAVSAVAGCVSIVDLNLLSFGSDQWTTEIRSKLAILRNSLNDLYRESRAREDKLRIESERKNEFSLEIAAIASAARGKKRLLDSDIENLAIRLQRARWIYFDVDKKKTVLKTPKEILNPTGALELLKYRVETVSTLGQHMVGGKLAEIAGEIDQEARTVVVSKIFRRPVQNFTLAHELGHAVLHRQALLHRDLPLDGSPRVSDRNERQADRFATHYLMPRKLVTQIFKDMFLSVPFRIEEDTAFALIRDSTDVLREKCKSKRSLATLLATAESYDGKFFESMTDFFGVSAEAMAIRLEELNLLEY